MWKDLIKKLPQDVEKLGFLGTISYVGALLCIVAAAIAFFTRTNGGGIMVIAGVALLAYSGFLGSRKDSSKDAVRREALETLKEVYNRLSEQTAKGTNEQTVSMTMTIAELPAKIIELLKGL